MATFSEAIIDGYHSPLVDLYGGWLQRYGEDGWTRYAKKQQAAVAIHGAS
ncbi:hypothetical protein [Sphingomonas sp. 3-13AW]